MAAAMRRTTHSGGEDNVQVLDQKTTSRSTSAGPSRATVPDDVVTADASPGQPYRTPSRVSWGERAVSRILDRQPTLRFLESGQAVFDQMSDAVFVFARSGQIMMVNETACRMLGYERDEILGRSAGVVFSQIDPPPEMARPDLRSSMLRVCIPPFDTALRTRSGQCVSVNFSTSFIRDESGAIIATLGIARSIQERKEFEERLQRHNELLEEEVAARTQRIRASEAGYRSLIQQIPMPVVSTDMKNRITSFNSAARELFGWDDDVNGTNAHESWSCKNCSGRSHCRKGAAAGGVWVGECRMSSVRTGESVMFHTCTALKDADDNAIGLVHVVTDLADPSAGQRQLLRDAGGLVLYDEKGRRSIVTRSEKMQRVLDLIAICSDSSATILIEGESGTGKDLVAQAIHLNGRRSDGPYLVVNCAALESHFLKSELFGHEKGAFTGATSAKLGLIEAADGGTLFIDEVGDMSLEVQAMLLRVLETQRFRRMGATEERSVAIQIVAATNKNLEMEVAAGRFRHDLFYRLNVLRFELPPLRERGDDIPLLVEHFLSASRDSSDGLPHKKVSSGAMRMLGSYSWPGNVRELRNVMERARVMSNGHALITKEHLPFSRLIPTGSARGNRGVRTDASRSSWRAGTESTGFPVDADGDATMSSLDDVERDHIQRVLRSTDGNKTRASAILGISRLTLRRKIAKYELKT
jgi:PAS domain S-box-containing protein